VVRGDALGQVWLFIVAPLLGGALAALAYWTLYPREVVLVAEGGVVSEEIVT
jgi:hypothetical protein